MTTELSILITGATGFIGSALTSRLSESKNRYIRAASRTLMPGLLPGIEQIAFDLIEERNFSRHLTGIDVIVHCAARVHVMKETHSDPLKAYRQANTLATLNFAQQAADAGVRRFVFVSTIKVNGEATELGHPYTADDSPAPQDPYGVSKLEAEQGLRELSARTGMEVVIIRPPLVYGHGVKANFASMVRWLRRGIPLPLGSVTKNRRSLVYLENLVDLLCVCIEHPNAANQTFLVSDGEDVSTTELLIRTGLAMSQKARLLPLPVHMLESVLSLAGKQVMAQRLCGTLQVDIEKTKCLLGWSPPFALDEGLFFSVFGINNDK